MTELFDKKALRRLIGPLFLDQILLMVVGILATLLLSHAGEAAVSAVSLVDMINLLLINVLMALATGGAVVVSQFLGKRDPASASHGASQVVTSTVLISAAVLVLVVLFHGGVVGVAWAAFAFRKTNLIAIHWKDILTWDAPMQRRILTIVTVVGQCVGAGDYDQAVAYTKRLIGRTYGITALISVAELAVLPLLLTLYSISPETSRLTFLLVAIHNGLAIVLWPVSFILLNALRAAGDVRFTMAMAIVSMFGFRIAFAWLLGVQLGLGVVGVWLAMGLDWGFRAVVFLLRFRGTKWKRFAVV